MHCDFWVLVLGALAIAAPAFVALRLGSVRRLSRSVPDAGGAAPGVSSDPAPTPSLAGGWEERAFAARDRALVRELEGRVPKGARVCDVGCGEGRLLRKLKDEGFDVYGIDIDIEQVSAARASVGEDRVRHGELADAGTAPEAFEAILFCDSIRYVARPHEVLGHALRMAKCVVITEPYPLWHFLGRLLFLRFLHRAGHLTRVDLGKFPVVAVRRTLFHRLWVLEGRRGGAAASRARDGDRARDGVDQSLADAPRARQEAARHYAVERRAVRRRDLGVPLVPLEMLGDGAVIPAGRCARLWRANQASESKRKAT